MTGLDRPLEAGSALEGAGKRIAVCVSGRGTNLRALRAAERRGGLGGRIVLVLADRECPALNYARAQGLAATVVSKGGYRDREAWDVALAAALVRSEADVVVLAGFMRVVGAATLGAFAGRILNVHPSLLPAFPGRDPIRDALAAGVSVTGVTVHLVNETLDGGPVVAQESVAVEPDDDHDTLEARIHAVEHRLLPRCVALACAGALQVVGRRVRIDGALAAGSLGARRALLSVSEKRGLVDFARGLAELGFELVSTGGTARALREAELDVTDVATVTGFPEMLDGRVKTLHPRVEAGILADLRRADHRAQLALAAVDPFEIVVVNLYRFAEAAARPEVELDDLVEEIDVGGPTMVRAAAKNHASVAIVTDPDRYPAILAELRDRGAVSDATRRSLALEAFRLTAGYDTTIAAELGLRLGEAPSWIEAARPAAPSVASAPEAPPDAGARAEAARPADAGPPAGRFPARLDLALERAALLRYGENPHQAAALYVRPGTDPRSGPFADGAAPLQGKALSYNNLLDAAAAAALARELRGSAIVIVKHGNPCGAAEAENPILAWERALAGDPVSAFGGVVGVRGPVHAALAERLAAVYLEVVVASSFDEKARAVLAARSGLRLLEDPGIVDAARPAIELRSAGAAVLATDADISIDDPAGWRIATSRAPTAQERTDLDFAWRVARHVRSNAIVLTRDRALVGVGAGQMSRVDSSRLAVWKAGPERARGAVCASDAFFPFPDGVGVLAAAGVTAFVQPGGSQRDAEVIAAAEAAGATMLLTGVRHFRH